MPRTITILPTVAGVALVLLGVGSIVPEHINKLSINARSGLGVAVSILGVLGIFASSLTTTQQAMQAAADQAKLLGELTGGDSYCYFGVVANIIGEDPLGTSYAMDVIKVGNYAMRDVSAWISQKADATGKPTDPVVSMARRRPIPLPNNGTALLGSRSLEFFLRPGKYHIDIQAANGQLSETLEFAQSGRNLDVNIEVKRGDVVLYQLDQMKKTTQ